MRPDAAVGPGHPRGGPFAFRPFVTIGWLAVVSAAFVAGYLLADYDADRAMARIQLLQTERDTLNEALARERTAHIRLERLHLIDREAKRAAQGQLADLQAQRLRLAKQVTYLRGLMREGAAGVVEVKEFMLTQSADDEVFDYQIIATQLVPEFGRSEGTAVVKLSVRRGDKTEILPLSALAGSSSGRHDIAFDHFQSLVGKIRVPPGLEPLQVIVDIQPKSDNFISSSESFAWRAGGGKDFMLRSPDGALSQRP
jgi:hypothetical protein